VYVETSVISYLVARRNQRDLLVAANQQLTLEWWENRRHDFELYASAVVIAEASRGNPEYAALRLEVLQQLHLIEVTDRTVRLADALLERAGLPEGANEDALHIATAAASGMDYLLTWNCKHIANAFIIPRINVVIRRHGLEPPFICTPQELLEG
jgi:predicted nucleic acid-binding protein